MESSKPTGDIRAERARLMREAQELLDANPGGTFTPAISARVDRIIARVDAIDHLNHVHAMTAAALRGGPPPIFARARRR